MNRCRRLPGLEVEPAERARQSGGGPDAVTHRREKRGIGKGARRRCRSVEEDASKLLAFPVATDEVAHVLARRPVAAADLFFDVRLEYVAINTDTFHHLSGGTDGRPGVAYVASNPSSSMVSSAAGSVTRKLIRGLSAPCSPHRTTAGNRPARRVRY